MKNIFSKLTILILTLQSLNLQADKIPTNILLGVSNASAQVEDDLNDSWMAAAKLGQIKAYNNYLQPEKKLEFWSKPEIEINLAHELGSQIFRMSIDWQRLVPTSSNKVLNLSALNRYREIVKMIKAKNMKVMLTLFHHSLPIWLMENGGWTNSENISNFLGFAKDVFIELNQDVDYWNTFNEPNVFALFTYVAGIWPPMKGSFTEILNLSFYKGDFFKAIDNMALAHNKFYDLAHEINPKSKIGIAHNTANYKPHGIFADFAVSWAWDNMNFYFPDLVKKKLDFMGINYYGAEYLSISGVKFSKETEYNDAGRAFDASGLYTIIKKFHERYNLPIHITENGTADDSDIFRSLYIREHLKAVMEAHKDGIPIESYIYWSLTDNFEWSDGYCPKFGLVAVDRSDMKRIIKDSFKFYKNLIFTREISSNVESDELWNAYLSLVGQNRSMCRAENGKDSLDVARKVPLNKVDWRFKKVSVQ